MRKRVIAWLLTAGLVLSSVGSLGSGMTVLAAEGDETDTVSLEAGEAGEEANPEGDEESVTLPEESGTAGNDGDMTDPGTTPEASEASGEDTDGDDSESSSEDSSEGETDAEEIPGEDASIAETILDAAEGLTEVSEAAEDELLETMDATADKLDQYKPENLEIEAGSYYLHFTFTKDLGDTASYNMPTYYLAYTDRDSDVLTKDCGYLTESEMSAIEHHHQYFFSTDEGNHIESYDLCTDRDFDGGILLSPNTTYRWCIMAKIRITGTYNYLYYPVTEVGTVTTLDAVEESKVTISDVSYDLGALYADVHFKVNNPNGEKIVSAGVLSFNRTSPWTAKADGDGYYTVTSMPLESTAGTYSPRVKVGTGDGSAPTWIAAGDITLPAVHAGVPELTALQVGVSTARIHVLYPGTNAVDQEKYSGMSLYYWDADEESHSYKLFSLSNGTVTEEGLTWDIDLTELEPGTEYKYYLAYNELDGSKYAPEDYQTNGTTFSFTTESDQELTTKDIPDPILYSALQKLTGSTTLTKENLAKIGSFCYSASYDATSVIQNLKGIEYLTGLRYFEMSITSYVSSGKSCTLKGIENLSGLTHLEFFELGGYTLSDLSFFDGMDSVCSIDFTSIKGLKNLDTLPSMKGLEIIRLYSCTDMSKLALSSSFPNLTVIFAKNGSLTSVGDLSGAPNIWKLELDGNNITSLDSFSALPKLTTLVLSDNGITSAAGLAGLSGLTSLEIDDNELKNLNGISKLTELTYLILDGNNLTSLAGVSNLKKLETLYANDNSIADIKDLAGLTALEELRLEENALTSADGLSGLTSLTSVDLYGNENLTSLGKLDNLPALKKLTVANCKLASFDGAENLTALTEITAYSNELTDISALAGLTALKTLELRNNSIDNIDALTGLTNLTYLNLNNNSLTEIPDLSGLTSITAPSWRVYYYCDLQGNYLTDEGLPMANLPLNCQTDTYRDAILASQRTPSGNIELKDIRIRYNGSLLTENDTITLSPGETIYLVIEPYPSNAKIDEDKLKITSDNPSITCDMPKWLDLVITSSGGGDATITITCDKITKKFQVCQPATLVIDPKVNEDSTSEEKEKTQIRISDYDPEEPLQFSSYRNTVAEANKIDNAEVIYSVIENPEYVEISNYEENEYGEVIDEGGIISLPDSVSIGTATVQAEWENLTDTSVIYLSDGGSITDPATGTDLSWEVDYEGNLVISGTGVIPSDAPWVKYNSSIVSVDIDDGITEIGSRVFTGCTLSYLTLPETLVKIDDDAFAGCEFAAEDCEVRYRGSEADFWEKVEIGSGNENLRAALNSYFEYPEGLWMKVRYEYTYTGAAIKPEVAVYYGDKQLTENVDYSVSYKNNIKAYTVPAHDSVDAKAPTVTVTGKGAYSGTIKKYFSIAKAKLTKANVQLADTVKVKGKISPVVYLGANLLKAGTDYTVAYYDENGTAVKTVNTKTAGVTYYVGITPSPKGSCTGNEIRIPVKVVSDVTDVDISKALVTIPKMEYGHVDKSQIKVQLNKNSKALVLDKDYTVTFANSSAKGTGTVTIRAKAGSGYTGSIKKNVTITAASIANAAVTLSQDGVAVTNPESAVYPYVKSGAKAEIASVVVNGTKLVAGRDYTVSYKNNTKMYELTDGDTEYNVKKAPTAVIKGAGNYTGTLNVTYCIGAGSLENTLTIVAPATSAKKAPVITVMDPDGKKLIAKTDYTVSDPVDNGDGTGSVTLTAGKAGTYTGSKTITYAMYVADKSANDNSKKTIKSVTVDKKTEAAKAAYVYTGSPLTPFDGGKFLTVIAKDTNKALPYVAVNYSDVISGKVDLASCKDGYTIKAYYNNTAKGTATVILTGTGAYRGDKAVTFSITQQSVSNMQRYGALEN